mgnify:CR=1 FL=1
MSNPTPTALVLEDEREIRQFVRLSLESEGWLVVEAGTVRQGLIEAGTRRPDLVIADLHYVYSLTATLGSQMQQDGRRWSVLLDEAHNLPERARRMYRASLAKADLMALLDAIEPMMGSGLVTLERVQVIRYGAPAKG